MVAVWRSWHRSQNFCALWARCLVSELGDSFVMDSTCYIVFNGMFCTV